MQTRAYIIRECPAIDVRRWHSGVREVGAVGHIGGSNALGGDENALGGTRMHTLRCTGGS